MDKRTRSKKAQLAIFLSGNGSNFESIAQACVEGKVNAEVCVVFSNVPDALGVGKARCRGLNVVILEHFSPRKAYDKKVLGLLSSYLIDWVVLCGYMRILSPLFLQAFPQKIINIHPSKLPLYPGLNAIEKAYKANESEVGVTVHYVDQGVDTGDIICQKTLPIEPGETLSVLKQRVNELEHKLYTQVLNELISK